MDPDTAVAQLSIVDGAWQDSPDNLAVVDDVGRGTLFLLAEVLGEAEGRDALARELLETARREFSGNRGSVALALTLAARAANDHFYNWNTNQSPETRRIAGLTAVVLRGAELFIAQAGPGVTCLVRSDRLCRYPTESPWFDPAEILGEFTTPGTVPLGLRRDYTPDIFHVSLQPGDTLVLATRSLVHVLNEEELLDTVMRRHPDEIVETLEDVAGATDLSAIALQLPGETVPPLEPAMPAEEAAAGPEEEAPSEWEDSGEPSESETAPEAEGQDEQPLQEEEEPPAAADQGPGAAAQAGTALIHMLQDIGSAIGRAVEQVDWDRMSELGAGAGRVVRQGAIFVTVLAIRAFTTDEKEMSATTRSRNAWRLGALIFPVVLLLAGTAGWVSYRAETLAKQTAEVTRLVDQARASIDQGKKLASTDRDGARAAIQKAISLAQQAQKVGPNSSAARSAYYDAEDALDEIEGTSILYLLPKIATFGDPKTNLTRVVAHNPDIFVLDRGAQRIYRFTLNEKGTEATPSSGDGTILKTGDKIGERTVGEIIDMVWVEAGRLVALDRAGFFLQYDPGKSTWIARAANDGSLWANVTLVSTYSGNLYLLDPTKNQIWKYAASADGIWSSAVSYLAPDVKVELSNAVDMAIDGDIWVLRADGSLWRFMGGKLVDYALQDLDKPIAKPVSLVTSQTMVGLYIADAGNQRIVEFDKVTGKYVRQFKPRTELRDAFNSLKALDADETSSKFFFLNGNQAYFASMPQ